MLSACSQFSLIICISKMKFIRAFITSIALLALPLTAASSTDQSNHFATCLLVMDDVRAPILCSHHLTPSLDLRNSQKLFLLDFLHELLDVTSHVVGTFNITLLMY